MIIPYEKIYAEVNRFTMVPEENLRKTIDLTIEVIEKEVSGVIVECGTWRGGSSFAMLLAQKYCFGKVIKQVWMFDSFLGLPSVDERDGPLAIDYQRNAYAPGNYNNCEASLVDVLAAIRLFGFTDAEVSVFPGWFAETIPKIETSLSQNKISLLRVDCDWFEPVYYVLNMLEKYVSEEGSIILDDYYAWDGCARAVHKYLDKNDLCYRIRSMEKNFGAFMYKRAFRKSDL